MAFLIHGPQLDYELCLTSWGLRQLGKVSGGLEITRIFGEKLDYRPVILLVIQLVNLNQPLGKNSSNIILDISGTLIIMLNYYKQVFL